jgi:D-arabinose 1-dehydrogenase-like Zn-dependent alcohol dehydrogenase
MVSDVQEPVPLVTAVVAALAGVRTGQAVVVLGTATTLRRSLEAGTGTALVEVGPADVVVALSAPDVPGAVQMLRPGGRLVALAADAGAVERTVALYGLVLRHTEVVGGRVAWSASVPT